MRTRRLPNSAYRGLAFALAKRRQLIASVRAEYDKIETIDPASPTYARLIALLDAADQDTLTAVAEANIKFVSALARNRIRQED